MIQPEDTRIEHLGAPSIASPLAKEWEAEGALSSFLDDSARVPLEIITSAGVSPSPTALFEVAGPRERIFFQPESVKAAIVTCGGLCPGLNNVIRAIFFQLRLHYGVKEVWGLRYGYHGLNPANGHAPILLEQDLVSDIHEIGGSILGTSRGPVSPEIMLDDLMEKRINILFPIGGDGTQRGALAISREAKKRGYPLAVVGVPKTIDNDIMYVTQTFGYMTAVDEARMVIDRAHTEARAVVNGVGLVKLMGRDSGFIAAGATLASQEANFCLVPEVQFEIDGEAGFLHSLERRLQGKNHAVVVVAEGAAQHLIPRSANECDASGNQRLGDIGLFLKDKIGAHFHSKRLPINVRYFDPSYLIRSCPANCYDALLCEGMARSAVHAAMAGKTNMVIGYWHGLFMHVPIALAASQRKKIDPAGSMWREVLASTGQPPRMIARSEFTDA
jgi:6-phosphofructokinase 1